MWARHQPALVDRLDECQVLDGLLEGVHAGSSGVLVIRGEAGVGKSALLDRCMRQASRFQVRRIAGVESEMELPFAGLHQLCAPMLDGVDSLPQPQRDALCVALGLAAGDPPDRFLVALAALGLLSHVAAQQPLFCVIDDAQWLDAASAQALGFVARRLRADTVAMVFAVREPSAELEFQGLPELRLEGLPEEDARALLSTVIPGRLDERVRDRLVAETRGNPLALLELPVTLTSTQLPGGFGLLEPQDLLGRIEESFISRLERLSEEARLLLLIAAAEPADDPLLVWRAAEGVGVRPEAAAVVESEGLLEIKEAVRFRHPLVRSAIYRSATPSDRRRAHVALAEATDPRLDPDRRAWHLAAAAAGPDEHVALELVRSADRAQARGGLASAAAFLRRSVGLTLDPVLRVDRGLAAAQASLHAGEFDVALKLLIATASETGTLAEFQLARVDLLRAHIVSASGAGGDAPGMLLKAAQRLEPLDVGLARETYLDAWGAAFFAGKLAAATGTLAVVSSAARSAADPEASGLASDLMLEGLAVLTTDGRAEAAPTLSRAIAAFRVEGFPVEKGLQWGVLASTASVELWDFDSWEAVITRQMDLAREAGALAPLSIALNGVGIVVSWRGDLAAGAGVIVEADAITEATRTRIAPYGAMLHSALRGRESEARVRIDGTMKDGLANGEGMAVQWAHWVTAMLYNGLGRYEEALAAARRAADDPARLFVTGWAFAELIEAAARTEQPEVGADALELLVESAQVSGTDWGLGIAARSRALLSEGDAADALYRAAIDRLSATRLRPELARAHLVYGEWLRREARRDDARVQLGSAHAMFAAMGAEGFAERARQELEATGAQVRRQADVSPHHDLTPQERHIARLAREGRTNVEIGAELYLSPRTIEWHLNKIFLKLGISSRRMLRQALPSSKPEATPV